MLFSPVKTEFKRLIAVRRKAKLDTGPEVVVEAALQAFQTKGGARRVNRCWKHAAKSILVWSMESYQWVRIGHNYYKGTHGNWVPKELAG
jgi:hypothetical protein